MSRRALVIGIDKYSKLPLSGCENDAVAVKEALEKNGDGSPNFSVRLLTSDDKEVSTEAIHTELAELFKGDADTILFFFAGHGMIDPVTNAGYIVSQDYRKGSWGISLYDLITMANNAYPNIKSTVIILDSCNSGFVGEMAGINNKEVSIIGTGVTILTACHRSETAGEMDGHGLFTGIMLDALSGSASDICGRITPASVYSHVDQTLGSWGQRPIYKANVQSFITLRNVSPKVPLEILRRLPTYFKNPADHIKLDPSFEPDRENVPDEYKHLPINPDNVRMFKELQTCNRYGLVMPVEAEHMYYAAMHSKSCRLTGLGAHYRKLAELGHI